MHNRWYGKGSGMIHPNMATTLNFVTIRCCYFYGSDSESII